MKKVFFSLLFFILSINTFPSGISDGDTVTEGKTINFWYLWQGEEAENIEKIITKFNNSQGEYIVNGLSLPDEKKIQLSIAADEGPDITDTFSSSIAGYASKGIMESLTPYIHRDNYSLNDFITTAIESVSYTGEIYALPISVNLMMLYYNKDLLSAAGYTSPPETDIELIKYGISLTQIDADGNILTEGFPDFPAVYYREHIIFAFGGKYLDKNGHITIDTPGLRTALRIWKEYRDKFGISNILKFNANSEYMTKADPFLTGNQALRIDGPWFGQYLEKNSINKLDYGVTCLPYPAGKPELKNSGQLQSSVLYIPSNSRNKDGAWTFIKWIHQKPQMISLSSSMGWIPSRISALNDENLKNKANFSIFASQAKSKNLTFFPPFAFQSSFQEIIKSLFDKVIVNGESIDKAIIEAEKEVSAINH